MSPFLVLTHPTSRRAYASMKMKTKVVLLFILIVAFAFPGIALAKPASYDACTGNTISGVVVAVDETTGEITVYTDAGSFCTVVKSLEEYDHPVINLLGQYYENVSLEDLSENLADLQGWVLFDATTSTWDFADETDDGAVSATVVGVAENPDGTYQIEFLIAGETVTQTLTTSDLVLYQAYLDSLLSNTVTLDLIIDEAGDTFVDETGNTFVSDGAYQIGAYHDDGIGLGVLVKLYAMADAYDVPVEELIARFKSGEGIGQLFKDENLGKPDILGVGHVFNELGKNPGHPNGKNNPSASNKVDKSNKPDNPGKGNKNK